MPSANGSAIVFHTNADSAPFSSAAAPFRAACRPLERLSTALQGRRSRRASGRTALRSAEFQTTGTLSAERRASHPAHLFVGQRPASKNFSSVSSFSATISITLPARCDGGGHVGGTAPSCSLPASSPVRLAFLDTISTTPRKSSPADGSWIGYGAVQRSRSDVRGVPVWPIAIESFRRRDDASQLVVGHPDLLGLHMTPPTDRPRL